MRIMNNNPLDLQGADGEVLTVTVDSSGTGNLVSFTFDGETSNLQTGISHNESIIPGDKEANRLKLVAARARLRALLQARIASKHELRATLGEAITPEESRSITSALENLEAGLRSLDQTSADLPSPLTTPASPPLTATPAPPTPPSADGGQSSPPRRVRRRLRMKGLTNRSGRTRPAQAVLHL